MDFVHDIFRTGFIVQVETHNLPNPRDGGKFIRLVQSELRTLNLDMAKRVQSLSNPCFCQAYRNCKTRALAIVPKRSNRPKVRYEGIRSVRPRNCHKGWAGYIAVTFAGGTGAWSTLSLYFFRVAWDADLQHNSRLNSGINHLLSVMPLDGSGCRRVPIPSGLSPATDACPGMGQSLSVT